MKQTLSNNCNNSGGNYTNSVQNHTGSNSNKRLLYISIHDTQCTTNTKHHQPDLHKMSHRHNTTITRIALANSTTTLVRTTTYDKSHHTTTLRRQPQILSHTTTWLGKTTTQTTPDISSRKRQLHSSHASLLPMDGSGRFIIQRDETNISMSHHCISLHGTHKRTSNSTYTHAFHHRLIRNVSNQHILHKLQTSH